jgi:hypothetical protein
MPLQDFEAFAKEQGWALKPITSAKLIWRYGFFMRINSGQQSGVESATVEHGLFYESRRPNGGGITAVYDSVNSTAYVVRSSR